MLLLDLPAELLVTILEELSDVRSLHDFTRVSWLARNLYVRHSLPILERVLSNAYPDIKKFIKGAVTARRCRGALRYTLSEDHCIKDWIVPNGSEPWSVSSLSAADAIDILQLTANMVNEVENLAEHCRNSGLMLPSRKKNRNQRSVGASSRNLTAMALFQLQSCTNIMNNLRLTNWPGVQLLSLLLRAEDRSDRELMLRRTDAKMQAVMEAHLESFCTECVHRMWRVIQTLQEEYQILRRHRLKPHPSSLVGLLFERDLEGGGRWTILESAMCNVLKRRRISVGYHGLEFRFPADKIDELHFTDISQFNEYIFEHSNVGARGRIPMHGRVLLASPADFSEFTNVGENSRRYLERFRSLLGLPHGNSTPVWHLVRPRTLVGPVTTANCVWAYESAVHKDNSPLGLFLKVCESENLERQEAKRRPRGVPRDEDGNVAYGVFLENRFPI